MKYIKQKTIKQQIEEVIKKNLPERKEDRVEYNQALEDANVFFNDCLDNIDTSLITDEVLKVVVGEIYEMPIETVGNSAKTVDQIIKLIKSI